MPTRIRPNRISVLFPGEIDPRWRSPRVMPERVPENGDPHYNLAWDQSTVWRPNVLRFTPSARARSRWQTRWQRQEVLMIKRTLLALAFAALFWRNWGGRP